jgi:DDE superfamily endonuclease
VPGIPDDAGFATKPQLAQQMLERAIDAGVPFAWFTADEVYGQAKYLHAWLEDRDVSYVLAIKRNDTLTMTDGEKRADALIAAVAAGPGSSCPPGPERTAPASTTGPGSRSAPAPGGPAAATGCSAAAR